MVTVCYLNQNFETRFFFDFVSLKEPNIYMFKIRKLQSCRVPGGVRLQSLQNFTADKVKLHFRGGDLCALSHSVQSTGWPLVPTNVLYNLKTYSTLLISTLSSSNS